MVTQKDVAKLAGVSFITVSRVVNGLGNVKKETRERVCEAIEALNYHPNHLGKALNSGRSFTIGVVALRPFEESLEANLYLIGLLDGIEKGSRAGHCDLMLSTDTYMESDADLLRLYRQRKADGLVFVGFQRIPQAQIAQIEAEGIPVVAIADRPDSEFIGWVDTDNLAAGRAAAKAVLQAGHRHAAFLGLRQDRYSNQNLQDRRDGFLSGMKARGAKAVLLEENLNEQGGREALRKLVRMDPRPTAIVCGNDYLALGVMKEAVELGLELPRDLSVVGFDAFLPGRFHQPSLASFQQPLTQMGQAAVELLFERIEHPRIRRRNRLFSLDFVPGDSLEHLPR
jgi:LacI family transcriptional regulator